MVPSGGAAGGAGGAGGGAAGAGGGGGIPRPTEASYSNDTNWGQALSFNAMKALLHSEHVFQIHHEPTFLKSPKTSKVLDLIGEFHVQYFFVLNTKIIPYGVPVGTYNTQLFNANDIHPFNNLKRWIILPVLARYGGQFPAETMVGDTRSAQDAQNWLNNVVYN
jgi:hypothetical protein